MALPTNLVDAIAGIQQRTFARFTRDVTYTPNDGSAAVTVRAFIRGVRSDDLFAAAMQQDVAAVLNASEFNAKLPARPRPSRMDRLRTVEGRSFSVEEWRGAPNDERPVFYKLLLRGGGQ